MCLQRGQGGGFDTNCCCCCCCCLVVVVVFAIVLDYNCVKSRVSSGLEKLSGFLKSKSIKIEELFQKATTTTIRNLPGLRERRFDLRVALFAHRGKRSQRTFPQAARADHGLLGALQRGENVLNCQRLPEIARDCQIVETMMLQAPIIITPPTDTRGHVGANLTLDCEARGFPAPTISWQVEL